MNPNPGKKLPIKWDISPKENLKNIYFFIKEDSLIQAKKVKNRILEVVRNIPIYEEKFAKEPFLEEIEGNFRSRTIWSYKIIYEVTNSEIIILKIFHTSQNPNKIKGGLF